MVARQIVNNKSAEKNSTTVTFVILWVGTFLLLMTMIYQWGDDSNSYNKKKVMVDDILLSSGELELGKNTALVNFGLNDMLSGTDSLGSAAIVPARRIIYDKILLSKIGKSRPKTVQANTGFTVKPIPEE